ncbi:Mor transcription activator family protein [Chitiniphilus shinanonensis]|uniref:Mor transcription activator family protein n=1 Tax=Chitiniphilus shinanonensis TaxID=553088 RepID=UPI003057A5D6
MKRDSHLAHKSSELLREMVDLLTQSVAENSQLAPEVARLVAQEATDQVAIRWGGSHFYLPKDHYRIVTEQHRAIYDKFDGHNTAELARETGLTERAIQRIVKRVRESDRAMRQGDLFNA